MFETPQTTGKSSKAGMWIGIAVVALIVAGVAAYFYTNPTSEGTKASASNASAAALPGKPDAIHDIRIVNVKMDKDTTGTIPRRAVSFRYSAVQVQRDGRDGAEVSID
jgi:Rieske Fe-S protein